jgi:AraC-like DNA-binding protein
MNNEELPIKTYMLAYKLLLLFIEKGHLGSEIINSKKIWQSTESYIRRKSEYQISIAEICDIFKCSRSALQKSCLNVTGTSPKKRIKAICLGEARGLLLHTEMNITAIAKRLGYKRLHEFTRDFSNYFKVSPLEFRKAHTCIKK